MLISMHIQAETINRLLKKQTRPRNKRNALATAEDRTPASQTGVPTPENGEEETEGAIVTIPEIPTMYRWISTTRPTANLTTAPGTNVASLSHHDSTQGTMCLSFSVPLNALPAYGQTEDQMEAEVQSRKMTAHCITPGCNRPSKYRMKSSFLQGVCGIEHLKLMERKVE